MGAVQPQIDQIHNMLSGEPTLMLVSTNTAPAREEKRCGRCATPIAAERNYCQPCLGSTKIASLPMRRESAFEPIDFEGTRQSRSVTWVAFHLIGGIGLGAFIMLSQQFTGLPSYFTLIGQTFSIFAGGAAFALCQAIAWSAVSGKLMPWWIKGNALIWIIASFFAAVSASASASQLMMACFVLAAIAAGLLQAYRLEQAFTSSGMWALVGSGAGILALAGFHLGARVGAANPLTQALIATAIYGLVTTREAITLGEFYRASSRR